MIADAGLFYKAGREAFVQRAPGAFHRFQIRLSPRTLFAETVRDSSDCDDPALVCGRCVAKCVGGCGSGARGFEVAKKQSGRFLSIECNAIEFDLSEPGSAKSGPARSGPADSGPAKSGPAEVGDQ